MFPAKITFSLLNVMLDDKSYRSEIHLPPFPSLSSKGYNGESIFGSVFTKKRDASSSAAYNLVIHLHKLGILDDHLLISKGDRGLPMSQNKIRKLLCRPKNNKILSRYLRQTRARIERLFLKSDRDQL